MGPSQTPVRADDAERWRVTGGATARRLDAWSEILAKTHLAFDVRATPRTPEDFRAGVTRRRFGELTLVDCVAAPFLEETGERARELWRQAYDLLMELEALERAVEAATRDLDRDRDSSTLISLKAYRDHKRRLINAELIDELARVMAPGAELRFASDWADYVDWTLERLLAAAPFRWTAERADDWRRPWHGFPGTRYEAKARRQGREPCFLIFRKRQLGSALLC